MRRLVCVMALAVGGIGGLGGIGCSGSSGAPGDGNSGDDNQPPTDGPSAGAHTVTVTLANRPMNAGMYSFLVAYQDGASPWQLAPAPTGDVYSLPINAPSWAIAFTCIGNIPGTTGTQQLRMVSSAHFAIGERTELTLDVPARCSDRASTSVQLTGTITNRPPSGYLAVQFGNRTTLVNTTSGAFSLETPPGTHDLLVLHVVPLGNGDYYGDSAVIQRNVAVTTTTARTIDFSAAAAYLRDWSVDASSGNAARIVASTTLYTASGTQLALVRESANWQTSALAASQSLATDVYDQSITVSTVGQSATVTNATTTPADQTYVAPPALGAVSSAVVSTTMPYPTIASKWTAYPSAIGYTWTAGQQLLASQCGGGGAMPCSVLWIAQLSPGVLGASPEYRMPDLSGLPGWKQTFQLAGSAQILGGVTATTSSAGASDFPTGIPAAGTQRTFARSDYAVGP